jgi:hypothetical protein
MIRQTNGILRHIAGCIIIMIATVNAQWCAARLQGIDMHGPIQCHAQGPQFQMTTPLCRISYPIHILIKIGDRVGIFAKGGKIV